MQTMLLLLLVLCYISYSDSRPVVASGIRRSSHEQYDCVDGLGLEVNDELGDCNDGRTETDEWVMEKYNDGRKVRTKETTTKNRYGDVIKKHKLFYVPNFCMMMVLKCNITDSDHCAPGTVQRWNPGFWTWEASPLSCQSTNLSDLHVNSTSRLTKRAPTSATCFMKAPKNNKNPTICGSGNDGELLPLKEIANQPGDYGAIPVDNEADLILSRGDGEFHWNELQLDKKFVCKKHYKELGREWKKKQARIQKKKVDIGLKCSMPNLENVRSHEKPTLAKRNTFLTKDEAEAILEINKVFVGPETALCEYHKDVVGDIEAEYRVIRKGYNLRNILPTSLAESPATPQALPNYRRLHQHFTCDPIDAPSEDRTDPDASVAGQYAKEIATENLRQAIIALADAAEIDPNNIHFTENFKNLAIRTQKQRVQIAKKLFFAISNGFAPDDPNYFYQLLLGKQSLDPIAAEIQAKLDNVVQQVLKCFQNSPTGTSKQQALALIAPFFELSEVRDYFPDLTDYYFKRARVFAKVYEPGQQLPPKDTVRRTVSDRQIEIAVQFITSAPVIMDLPFGTATVTTTAGNKEDIPLVVRMQVNERIYRQYVAYMQESNQMDLALSRSTILRILKYCTATTRKSLQGLDYFAWAGGEGFSALHILVEKLVPYAQDTAWGQNTKSQLKEARQYLKLDYKLHVKDSSRIPDHCMNYALSDPTNPVFAATLDHALDMRCERCEALKNVILEIRSVLDVFPTDSDQQKREKEEMLYEFENAVNSITEMKKHIIRTIKQDQARTDILESLDETSVFLVVDWAMKHLPVAGRVPQSDWFGQRGISWHITHVTSRVPSSTGYRTRIFVHVFESVSQDGAAVIAILHSVLTQIKRELPHVSKAFVRSDNAGCYKSAQTIAAVPEISTSTGVFIQRWDFSDPQSGKGACDRTAAVVKNHVRLYAAENHRCTNAEEFAACANSYNGIRSATVVLSDFTADKRKPPTIPGITRYNNFEFKHDEISNQFDIIVWQAYKIGTGLTLQRKTWQGKKLLRELRIIRTFTEGSTSEVTDATHWKALSSVEQEEPANVARHEELDDDDDNYDILAAAKTLLFPCPEVGCIKTYQSHNALSKHLENGNHKYKPEKVSLRDTAINAYKKELEGLRLPKQLPLVESALNQVAETVTETPTTMKGWAIRIKETCTRFSIEQRTYLTTKFDEGAKTGRKFDPNVISKQMRGEFPRDRWLTSTQIASYWSRLAQSRRAESLVDQGTCEESTATSGESQPVIDVLNEEAIANDPYFNTVQDDIYDAIDENSRHIFQR